MKIHYFKKCSLHRTKFNVKNSNVRTVIIFKHQMYPRQRITLTKLISIYYSVTNKKLNYT